MSGVVLIDESICSLTTSRLAKAVASRCEQVLPDLAKKIVDETSKLAPLGKKLEDAASKVF